MRNTSGDAPLHQWMVVGDGSTVDWYASWEHLVEIKVNVACSGKRELWETLVHCSDPVQMAV